MTSLIGNNGLAANFLGCKHHGLEDCLDEWWQMAGYNFKYPEIVFEGKGWIEESGSKMTLFTETAELAAETRLCLPCCQGDTRYQSGG